jgi:peroxiredoxin
MFRKTILLFTFIFGAEIAFAGKIPDFSLKDLNNKTVSYSQIKGKRLTVIDFWATWCKPCLRSVPELIKLYERYKEEGVQFIGISVDSPRNLSKVKPFANSLGINYPVLLDLNSQVMTELKVTVMPSILIIDEQDEIVFFHQGYRAGDEDVLEQEIKKLLEKTKQNTNEN